MHVNRIYKHIHASYVICLNFSKSRLISLNENIRHHSTYIVDLSHKWKVVNSAAQRATLYPLN